MLAPGLHKYLAKCHNKFEVIWCPVALVVLKDCIETLICHFCSPKESYEYQPLTPARVLMISLKCEVLYDRPTAYGTNKKNCPASHAAQLCDTYIQYTIKNTIKHMLSFVIFGHFGRRYKRPSRSDPIPSDP